MQERRTTVRLAHSSRVHYCPSSDLIPRDGQLTDLSERGAGLLALETHYVGEQVTVSFWIPGDEETPVTATGAVRWSHERPDAGQRYPMGVTWFALEETTQHRLQRFLADEASPPSGPLDRLIPGWRAIPPSIRGQWTKAVALVLGLCSVVALWMTWRNQYLALTVTTREATIRQLEHQESAMGGELALTKLQLAETSGELNRLDAQSVLLQSETRRLGQDIVQFQQMYQHLREDREALMRRVLDFQQERLLRKAVPLDQLQLAIQEAVEARMRRRVRSDADPLDAGNRGYVVLHGQPTSKTPAISIRVRDPQETR